MRRTLLPALALAALVAVPPACTGTSKDEPPREPDPQCASNDDCAEGLICREGACVTCSTHGDCGRARECDPLSFTCVWRAGWGGDCATHDGCPLGMFCIQGLCQPGALVQECGALGQCPEGMRCHRKNRVCEEDIGCYSAADCLDDETCNPGTLRCEPRCTEETEADVCAARERCTAEGRCVECETDPDCGPGLTCNVVAGRCAGNETCFSDAQCPAGKICNRATSTCTPPPPACASDDDCLEDERCDLARGKCVLRACQPDQDEPNDTREQAVRLGPGQRTGLTVCGTEEDWYVIPLRRGDRINVNVDADILVAGGLSVQLQDSLGRILDEDPYLVDATVAADADYFLRIRTHDERAAYALHVLVASGVPCDDDPHEDNDSVTGAAPLAAGIHRNLHICPADVDWFVVSVPAGKTLTATLTHDPLGGDLDLLLYDGDGATLLRSSRTTAAVEEVTVAGVTGGRAFLEVLPSDDRTQNAYDLSVSVQ
jgi:hypothetical protein